MLINAIKINTLALLIICQLYVMCFSMQIDNDRSEFYDFGKRFYSENIVLPTNSLDSIDIVVLFRVSHSLMLFQKTQDNNFFAKPYFEFEFKNSQDIIKKRIIWTDSVVLTDYNETKNKSKFRYGYVISRVYNDNYNIYLLAKNQDNTVIIKQKLENADKIDYNNKLYVSKPFFLFQDYNNTNSTYYPFILDGKLSFTSKPSRMMLITVNPNTKNIYQYYISNYIDKEKKEKSVWDEYLNFSGQDDADTAIISFKQTNKSQNIQVLIDYTKKYSIEDASNIGVLNIELFSEQLVPGKYNLIIINPSTRDTIKRLFEVEWENMPLSLKKPKYAVSLMYYILTDSEFDAINSGSETDIMRKIIAYWKKRDPTPFSPYNEAMVEYFSRADYAFFNFQTISEKDGAKTDRGKIYILYGPPDSIERKLVNSEAIEIWHYKKLIKEFIFQTKSTGVYKLIKINE